MHTIQYQLKDRAQTHSVLNKSVTHTCQQAYMEPWTCTNPKVDSKKLHPSHEHLRSCICDFAVMLSVKLNRCPSLFFLASSVVTKVRTSRPSFMTICFTVSELVGKLPKPHVPSDISVDPAMSQRAWTVGRHMLPFVLWSLGKYFLSYRARIG